MKLYETKITVDMAGKHDHIDDEALIEMCDEIGEEVAAFVDRLAQLVDEIAAKKGVNLNVYSD